MSAILGETLVIEQASGPSIELVVWGDEFYVRYETKDGYTVCYDAAAGLFCYADLRNGRLVPSGASANKRPPVGLGRHLQESPEVQRARFEARYAALRSRGAAVANENRNLTLGRNDGLLEGRRVSAGDVLGLTVLVAFTDVAADVTRDDVNDLLNAEDYNRNGNFCSVREYFRIVSDGKLNYRNHVVGPIALSHTKKHYETTSLVPEAFGLAMAALDTDGFDLGQFDSRDEGIFDAVNFMYARSSRTAGWRSASGLTDRSRHRGALGGSRRAANHGHRVGPSPVDRCVHCLRCRRPRRVPATRREGRPTVSPKCFSFVSCSRRTLDRRRWDIVRPRPGPQLGSVVRLACRPPDTSDAGLPDNGHTTRQSRVWNCVVVAGLPNALLLQASVAGPRPRRDTAIVGLRTPGARGVDSPWTVSGGRRNARVFSCLTPARKSGRIER